jgi:hypothetical protein
MEVLIGILYGHVLTIIQVVLFNGRTLLIVLKQSTSHYVLHLWLSAASSDGVLLGKSGRPSLTFASFMLFHSQKLDMGEKNDVRERLQASSSASANPGKYQR